MEDELMHDLVAAYALDALDADEQAAFEAHLARCERCREELIALSAPVTALAYGAPAASPPDGLRARILAAARAERAVVPLRPRWAYAAAGLAAVASCAAVGLGVWVGILESGPSPALTAVPLRGARGSLVVAKGGRSELVAAGLPAAPRGKTYEAWVLLSPTRVLPAGLFTARNGTVSLELTHRVPKGAVVAVTIERAGGAPRPTGARVLTSDPA